MFRLRWFAPAKFGLSGCNRWFHNKFITREAFDKRVKFLQDRGVIYEILEEVEN